MNVPKKVIAEIMADVENSVSDTWHHYSAAAIGKKFYLMGRRDQARKSKVKP